MRTIIENHFGVQKGWVRIPESWIGCVLGPQLKTLEAIRFYSGCKIDVFKNGAVANIPADIRVIRICGCGDNTKVQLAKAIVERIINETHENRRARSCSSFLPSEAP
ncbi:hypothetical protein GCK32_020877 [Trichostrongylus colubriformis]|uniref:K Homology domain-containing protein n=1 Tax=Trichostrongylus colubriformis TaxID=6319 RepID=A0AAN8J3J8_TRICO